MENEKVKKVSVAKKGTCRCGISAEESKVLRVELESEGQVGKVCICEECLNLGLMAGTLEMEA